MKVPAEQLVIFDGVPELSGVKDEQAGGRWSGRALEHWCVEHVRVGAPDGQGEDVVGFVERDEEGLAAEAIPGDEKLPKPEAVQVGMRMIEQINDRTFADEVLAGAIAAGNAKGNGRDGLGESGDSGIDPDALLIRRSEKGAAGGAVPVLAPEPGGRGAGARALKGGSIRAC